MKHEIIFSYNNHRCHAPIVTDPVYEVSNDDRIIGFMDGCQIFQVKANNRTLGLFDQFGFVAIPWVYGIDKCIDGFMVFRQNAYGRKSWIKYRRNGEIIWISDYLYAKAYTGKSALKIIQELKEEQYQMWSTKEQNR